MTCGILFQNLSPAWLNDWSPYVTFFVLGIVRSVGSSEKKYWVFCDEYYIIWKQQIF